MSMKKRRLAPQPGNVGQKKRVMRRLWMDVPRETTALGAVPISGVAPASSRQRAAKMAALRLNQDTTRHRVVSQFGVVAAIPRLRDRHVAA